MDASGSSSGAPPGRAQRANPGPPRIEPFVPRTDHNPRELKSWARRTGFNPNLSGETASVFSDQDSADEPRPPARLDLENGIRRRGDGFPRKPEIEPVVGRGRNGAEDGDVEIGPAPPRAEKEKRKVGIESGGVGIMDERKEAGHEPLLRVKSDGPVRNGHTNGSAPVFPVKPDEDSKEEAKKDEKGVEIDFFSDDQVSEGPSGHKQPSDFGSAVTDSPGVSESNFFSFSFQIDTQIDLVLVGSPAHLVRTHMQSLHTCFCVKKLDKTTSIQHEATFLDLFMQFLMVISISAAAMKKIGSMAITFST